jgi:hypothetical protein
MNDRRSIVRTKIAKDALLFFGGQAGVRGTTNSSGINPQRLHSA